MPAFVDAAITETLQGISQPGFFFLAALAVLMVSISKSGFGGAMGSLSAPLLIMVTPPKLALTILLPLFMVADVIVCYTWRKHGHRMIIAAMIIGGVAGTALGWVFFRWIDDGTLRMLIGSLAIFTALRYGWNHYSPAPPPAPIPLLPERIWKRAAGWCTAAGFASFVSLTGGIPAQIYLLPFGLTRQVFVGTLVWFFLCINIAKVPFFFELGLFNLNTLIVSSLLLPVLPLGIFLGRYLNQRLSDTLFYHLSHIFLLLMGLQLVIPT